jgi:hypothetical protein
MKRKCCEKMTIDPRFEGDEYSPEFQAAYRKFDKVMRSLIQARGGFQFDLSCTELMVLRVGLEFYLRYPDLIETAYYAYEFGKRIIEKIDTIFHELNFSHSDIAIMEKPESPKELAPVVKKVLCIQGLYPLQINPLEFSVLSGALVLLVKEGLLNQVEWQKAGVRIDAYERLLGLTNAKLRKLGFTEREVFLLNNQFVGKDYKPF